jgi:hypothetical protein
MKKLFVALALMVSSALFVVIPAGAAHADFGCPGTRDVWRPYNNSNGVVAAETQLYKTASGVCVNLVSRNQYYNRDKNMLLTVCTVQHTGCVTNSGNFAQYAGPIDFPIGGNNPKCVYVRSKMGDGYGNLIMDDWIYLGSCN